LTRLGILSREEIISITYSRADLTVPDDPFVFRMEMEESKATHG
jgi:hypothetical protein